MLNKRGYVLIYAIGVLTLLILLTATLTNITMSRTIWVDKNVKNIKDLSKAKMQVESASSELITYFDSDLFKNITNLSEIQDDIQNKFIELHNTYGVIIRDLTVEPCDYPKTDDSNPCFDVNTDSTYAYDIIYENGEIVAQRKFFLSTIPSYLYYALGSNTDMTINGGAYVIGDIFVRNDLYLTNSANYKLNDNLRMQDTTFLTVDSENSIYFAKPFVENSFYSCTNSIISCYDTLTDPNTFLKRSENFNIITESFEIPPTFDGEPPKIKKYTDKFVNVDFDSSYIYYLNETIKDNNPFEIDDIEDINNLNVLRDKFDQLISENRLNGPDQSVIISDPVTVIDHDFNFNKDEWVIIDGDLKIENYYAFDQISIDANFIVTGSISIFGYVQLNSTIYALGNGFIHDCNINSADLFEPNNINDNQFVLLTKGNMQFSKINEFENDFDSRFEIDDNTEKVSIAKPDIEGFFYSEGNVSLYTINSYLTIKGGIFSNESKEIVSGTDSIGLLINSYRGIVKNNDGDFLFLSPENYLESRFVIEYSPDIILDQPKGLPLSKEVNYIFEDIIIK